LLYYQLIEVNFDTIQKTEFFIMKEDFQRKINNERSKIRISKNGIKYFKQQFFPNNQKDVLALSRKTIFCSLIKILEKIFLFP